MEEHGENNSSRKEELRLKELWLFELEKAGETSSNA